MIIRKFITAFILTAFTATCVVPPAYAQSVLNLPQPGSMVALSPAFSPVVLRGMKVDAQDPFKFDFLVDPGRTGLAGDALKDASLTLIKYFLAAVTTPEEDLWVNLSPYEKDRIIPDAFGQTEMGRDLLSQDYMLKQITASLMYPESDLGKTFWQKVYQRAFELYGTSDVPVDTFNKVWIVPDRAEVYEDKGVVYIGESHLKVMLETDYLAMDHNGVGAASGRPDEAKNILRQVIIPVLEKEVNEGKNFALLRQVYQSLILAAWYKQRLKEGLLNRVYADKNKVAGVDVADKEISRKIYGQYIEAFKKGVYNYVKDEYDVNVQETVARKYFSGGFNGSKIDQAMIHKSLSELKAWVKGLFKVSTRVRASHDPAAAILEEPPVLQDNAQQQSVDAAEKNTKATVGQKEVIGRIYYILTRIASWDGKKGLGMSRNKLQESVRIFDKDPRIAPLERWVRGIIWGVASFPAFFGVRKFIEAVTSSGIDWNAALMGAQWFVPLAVLIYLDIRIAYMFRLDLGPDSSLVGLSYRGKLFIHRAETKELASFIHAATHEMAHVLKLPNNELLANAYEYLIAHRMTGSTVADQFSTSGKVSYDALLYSDEAYVWARAISRNVENNLAEREMLLRLCVMQSDAFHDIVEHKYGEEWTLEELENEADLFVRQEMAKPRDVMASVVPRPIFEEPWHFIYGYAMAKLALEYYGNNNEEALRFVWKLGETRFVQPLVDWLEQHKQAIAEDPGKEMDKALLKKLFDQNMAGLNAGDQKKDDAMNGGIDLNMKKLDLNIRGDGSAGVRVIDPDELLRYQDAPGFVPVILGITPVNDVPAFLGLSSLDSKENLL